MKLISCSVDGGALAVGGSEGSVEEDGRRAAELADPRLTEKTGGKEDRRQSA